MSRVLRKRARVCYYEPEEPSFDQYIFCSSCSDYVYEYCSIHGPLLVIPDDKVPSPTGFPPLVPRAALTLPRTFLHLAASTIPGADIGVFSTLTLPCGVRFGPYRGVKTNNPNSSYCWQLYDRERKPTHAVDARDPDRSNWMRYVNCSRHSTEQNLLAFQYQGQLYYRTIRIIPRFTELLVFYGSEYAHALKIDLRRYHAPAGYTQIIELKSDAENPAQTETDAEKRNTNYPAADVTENVVSGSEKDENDQNLNANKVLTSPEVSEQAPSKDDSNETKSTPESETFICDYCTKAFKEKALLILHIASHSNINAVKIDENSLRLLKYPCATCNTKFATKSELINHEIKMHDSKVKYKACNTCDYKTVDSSRLKIHMRMHSGVKPYQCTICNSKFSKNGSLKNHQRIHTGEKPYMCTICNSKFRIRSTLKTHQRIHTGEKPYMCTICNSKFRIRSTLKTHQRIHTGEKPYMCTICNSTFSKSCNLKTHQGIHTGEKPFMCTICNSSFRQSYKLKDHLRTHTGEKPYMCTICNSKFSKSCNLKNHQRIHTGEKPFMCTICNSSFRQSYKLKDHLRTHTGEKPYMCATCNSKFSRSSSLKEHQRIHTGEKPYTCTFCDSKFTRSSHLKRHITIHTAEIP